MDDDEILLAIANLISITTRRLSINSSGDVWVDGNFRYGYVDRIMCVIYRENPVDRTLRRHGIKISEGRVSEISEPQYDMHIRINQDGTTELISDQRSWMEAEYWRGRKSLSPTPASKDKEEESG